MMSSFWKRMLSGPPGSRLRPADLFLFVVLPTALVLPAMLLITDGGAGAVFAYFPEIIRERTVAAVFITEILTVFLMTWVIRDVARTLKLGCRFSDAFTVAALCPLPLWLSSLALAAADRAFLLVAFAAGLLGSALLLHRSILALFSIQDEEEAMALSSTAFSVAGIVWFLLAAFLMVP